MIKVIVVCGLPGCGKSTIAEAVAQHLRLPIFSVDPIESAIMRSGIQRSFETGLAAYLVAETLATEQLKLGQSVIIDAVSGVVEAKDMWHKLAKKFDAELVVIECFSSDDNTQRLRIENRKRDIVGIPEITWEKVKEYEAEYVQWEEPHLSLDATNKVDENISKAVGYAKK